MNNILNIKRFGKVLKHDGLNFFPSLTLTLAILWAIPVVIYLFALLMPTNERHVFDVFSRITLIGNLAKISLIIAPARLYKYCNDSRKGIGYAMLPASTLEKFLGMVIYCAIVTPIIYIAGALAIDSILALFNGSYDGFAVSYYFDTQTQINHALSNNNMFLDDTFPLFINNLSSTFMKISSMLGILMLSSIFMFGNMVFKKHKTSKMIGVLILLSIIFMIVIINYAVNHEMLFQQFIEDNNITEFIKRLITIIMNVVLYVEIIISAVLLWGVFHKIKTQRY